ncbi:MAG: hypothetical protein ABIY70_00190 [Capsulimonas sp.]|uniref:hypothetical protein n=1 Tax=Capsulimonas sp. TaxID=2494211 RepID=UPI0032639B3C
MDYRSPIARRIALCLALACVAALAFFVHRSTRRHGVQIPNASTAAVASAGDAALPIDLTRDQLTQSILDGLRKPVMGRMPSLGDVARVADQCGPIIAEATLQPETQAGLDQMAQDEGITREDARERWVHLQEADLLLESGGDPDALSGAGAAGVAQWMPGKGGHGVFPTDLPASRRLTSSIDTLKRRIAWVEYWSQTPENARAPAPASVGPALTSAQAAAQLPVLRARLTALREQRRRLDPRYDPRRAIFAQTNYLLNLYPRFPGGDWLFQAYHGGEAGVQRTLKKYLASEWPGSAAAAIRYGDAGSRLSFEQVYLTSEPRRHAAAFSYLYGRGDDHRHYWWKLRAAQEAIALYRRDPAEFRRQWEALMPGRSTDALWYGATLAIPNTAALTAATERGELTSLSGVPGVVLSRPAQPIVARPEARGALALVAGVYQHVGGNLPLTLGDAALSQQDAVWLAANAPSPAQAGPPEPDIRPGGGPLANFNAHTTGVVFDLERPSDRNARKILEYALGYWKDRQVLWWKEERDDGVRRYHVAPNPAYRLALARIGATGAIPATPGL